MLIRKLKVTNKSGVHARPAGMIVDLTSKFKSDVFFVYGGARANAKSILNLMMLAITPESEVDVEIDGPDAEAVFVALEKLFDEKFQEENQDT